MPAQIVSKSALFRTLLEEGRRRVLLLAAIMSVVAVVALAVALALPKRYDASTLIVVESSATIKPLVEGRAVPATAHPDPSITMQILDGHKILRELLVFGGWVAPPPAPQPDAREEAVLIAKLRSHIKIDTPSENIVRIAFSDTDPERTYKVANKIAEIYVRENDDAAEGASRDAFEFLDKQVKEYSEKLAAGQQEVLTRYARQPLPGHDAKMRPNAVVSTDELAALRVEKSTLEAQLARRPEPAAAAVAPATQELVARVTQLRRERERLVQTYTEQHPDVRRVTRELAAATAELERVQAETPRAGDAENAAATLDEGLARAARARLDLVNRRIASVSNAPPAVHAPAPSAAVPPTVDPEMKGIGHDTELSELVRRYEATRDVYQDLLKRREAARVSMELALQHRSMLRITEPAELPATASGLRLMHLCLVGLALSVALPVGVLFAMVQLDRRVRSARQIESLARVPFLVSIAAVPMGDDFARLRRNRWLAMAMVVGVITVYAAVFFLRTRAAS